jgi:hypothetical protein
LKALRLFVTIGDLKLEVFLMRCMAVSVFFALLLSFVPVAFGAEPFSDHSSTVHTNVSGTEVNPELQEYLLEGKQTVEGVILDVDQASGLMTIRTQSGDVSLVFDHETHFRLGLKPGDIENARVGLKMAGLYIETDGTKRLVRVMVLKELPPVKHKGGKHGKKKKTLKKKKSHKKKRRR